MSNGNILATRNGGDLQTMDTTLAGEVLVGGGAMVRTQNAYTTAITVQRPRDLRIVAQRLEQEADLGGGDFFYGWGQGKDRIEGPSVKLALAAARCFGNCVIDQQPVIETSTSYIFGATFVDLETGYTITRQFRQSKSWTVYGKHDEERKADIRFQIGQSKAIRNVVLNAIPSGLIERAMERAKAGVRDMIDRKIKDKGLPAAVEGSLAALLKLGVDEKRVLARFGLADRKGITLEDLVIIVGDLKAIQNGQAWADELYPQAEEAKAPETASLNARLSQAETAAAPEKKATPPRQKAKAPQQEQPQPEASTQQGEIANANIPGPADETGDEVGERTASPYDADIRDAMDQEWPEVRSIFVKAMVADLDITRIDADSALGRWLLVIGKKGKEETISIDERVRLYKAIKAKTFDSASGKIAE